MTLSWRPELIEVSAQQIRLGVAEEDQRAERRSGDDSFLVRLSA